MSHMKPSDRNGKVTDNMLIAESCYDHSNDHSCCFVHSCIQDYDRVSLLSSSHSQIVSGHNTIFEVTENEPCSKSILV